jgi:hypothetical protein
MWLIKIQLQLPLWDRHYLTEILLNVVLNTINNVLLEVRFIMYSLALLNIIYSYKYLESDLIKHFSRDIYPFVGSTTPSNRIPAALLKYSI